MSNENLTPRDQIRAASKAVDEAEDAREALCAKLLAEHEDLDRDTKFFAEAFSEKRGPNMLPKEVARIEHEGLLGWLQRNPLGMGLSRTKPGALVKVRPCGDDNPENKTFLGIYVGELPTGLQLSYNEATATLRLRPGTGNPAILVPSLGRLVFGMESWWGEIRDESELKDITDEDIDSLPYVKALRNLPSL